MNDRIGTGRIDPLVARIEALIDPALAGLGYEIVRTRFGGSARQVLQIMADRRDGQPITVEDCAEISRTVSALLDVEDPISGAYDLEVSSPGIDRPLVRPRDFVRYCGFEAKLELAVARDGRRRFRGTITEVDETSVTVTCEGEAVLIPFAELATAKLVLNDALIAFAANAAEE